MKLSTGFWVGIGAGMMAGAAAGMMVTTNQTSMKYGLGLRYACLGPFETVDLGGIDVFYKIASYLFGDLENRVDVPDKLKSLYENGCWGVKSGRGFYDYTGGKAEEAIKNRDRKVIRVADALLEGEK